MKLPVNLVKKCCDFTTDVKIGERAQRFWFTTVKHKFDCGEPRCVSAQSQRTMQFAFMVKTTQSWVGYTRHRFS